MLMIKKNLSVYWNNQRYLQAQRGYALMSVLMALAVASLLAVSSLVVLSFGGNYYASVDMRKEIAVRTFSFLEQKEAGIVSPSDCFRKGALFYTVQAENRGALLGENIVVEGEEGNQRQRFTVWRPLISP